MDKGVPKVVLLAASWYNYKKIIWQTIYYVMFYHDVLATHFNVIVNMKTWK